MKKKLITALKVTMVVMFAATMGVMAGMGVYAFGRMKTLESRLTSVGARPCAQAGTETREVGMVNIKEDK